MAKYLDTAQISSELMQLVKEAKEKIILVTYSLQVNSQIQERLKTKSKIGTLSEIALIYGNTKIKNSELEWMSEVEDLKVWQKKNLHAKCYINENKAIISSMNLYDYSQTNNIEMGFLITKDEDPEAYYSMMDDINNMKVNGERMKPWLQKDGNDESITTIEEVKEEKPQEPEKSKYSYIQQLRKQMLEEYREEMSSKLRQRSQTILPDNIIQQLLEIDNINFSQLHQILNNDKRVKQIGGDIIELYDESNEFTLGRIMDTRYQSDDFSYDQIKMQHLNERTLKWYDTTMELPEKNQVVAVSLNRKWFNEYYDLEDTDAVSSEKRPDNNAKTEYLSTKELSNLTGITSRNINSTLVKLGFMKKDGDDWIATSKGKNKGAIEKEGQYGQFVIWPKEIEKILK